MKCLKKIPDCSAVIIAACLYSVQSNIELLYLKNNSISSVFCMSLFDVRTFMEDKQFFLVTNVLFGLFVSCFICSRDISDYYTIYTFNSIRSEKIFFWGRMAVIAFKQAVFSAVYCSVLMILCMVSCGSLTDYSDMILLLKSIAAVAYSGTFFCVICSTASLFFDARISVLSILVIMLTAAFVSMTFGNLPKQIGRLLIINPITAVTAVTESSPTAFILDLLIFCLVIFAEMFAAVGICQRKELK